MQSDDKERVELELAAQVRALRGKLRARDEEIAALQDRVASVTTQLHETSDELEGRMAFVADAMTQIESLETQVAEANRSILTREMQLHEGEQREKALEVALQSKEKLCEHWESEFHRVERELSVQKAAERELNQELQTKAGDTRVWKAKAQGVMMSVDELKLQNSNLRKKERELVATLRQQVEAVESSQQLWKARLVKRELKIESLRKQCQDRQDELEQVERERRQKNEEHERDKLDVTEHQLDKQKLVVVLREKVAKLTTAVEKAQVKEKLFRKEIF
ncbi:Centromere-associated protein E, partial [Phytophthora palmivora]